MERAVAHGVELRIVRPARGHRVHAAHRRLRCGGGLPAEAVLRRTGRRVRGERVTERGSVSQRHAATAPVDAGARKLGAQARRLRRRRDVPRVRQPARGGTPACPRAYASLPEPRTSWARYRGAKRRAGQVGAVGGPVPGRDRGLRPRGSAPGRSSRSTGPRRSSSSGICARTSATPRIPRCVRLSSLFTTIDIRYHVAGQNIGNYGLLAAPCTVPRRRPGARRPTTRP